MHLPRVGPRPFLRASQAALVLVVANVVSGGAVRLSDSGLGCPDWPTCAQRSFTPPSGLHPALEFGNRMVVVVLCVAVAAVVAGALLRQPRRRDLVWLSGGLAAGVVGEAVLGGIVVYTKLNPYAVMTHFALGIAVLSVAVVLALRAGRMPEPGTPVARRSERRLCGALLGLLGLVVLAGTATTGAGPHAGGKGATRLAVPLDDMARTHSALVLAVSALLLALLWRLRRTGAPVAVEERGQMLLAAMVGQGVIGYVQYFSHLPALLVGVHLLGVCVVWCAALWFRDGLRHHVPEALALTGPPGPHEATATVERSAAAL